LPNPSVRPAYEERHTVTALVEATLLSPHGCVEDLVAAVGAVVGKKDEDRVVAEAGPLEIILELADVLVEIGDHAKKLRRPRAFVWLRVSVLDPTRRVWNVGCEMGEKGLTCFLAASHPAHRLAKPDIGAVALELLELAVLSIRVVEIVVRGMIRDRCDAPGAVPHRVAESAVDRPVRIAVAEMPLARKARAVSVRSEHLGEHAHIAAYHRSSKADERRAVVESVATG